MFFRTSISGSKHRFNIKMLDDVLNTLKLPITTVKLHHLIGASNHDTKYSKVVLRGNHYQKVRTTNFAFLLA